MKTFWDQRYSEERFAYGVHPNLFFKEQIDARPPGKLLLPCEGEGRNAVYAASIGWDVHAFDQSTAGRDKCDALAAQHGVGVRYDIADATEIDLPQGEFDAIALIFAHFPIEIRESVHRKCIGALKPGGMLWLEAFNPKQIGNDSGGPKNPGMLYSHEMLLRDFNGIDILSEQETETVLDEGPYHQGKANVIQLIGRKKM